MCFSLTLDLILCSLFHTLDYLCSLEQDEERLLQLGPGATKALQILRSHSSTPMHIGRLYDNSHTPLPSYSPLRFLPIPFSVSPCHLSHLVSLSLSSPPFLLFPLGADAAIARNHPNTGLGPGGYRPPTAVSFSQGDHPLLRECVCIH
jgi:hypothetical protein